jgi:hypothetical protein
MGSFLIWTLYQILLRWSEQTNSVAQEPKCSSPHSQQPATGPYPEPVESNPHPQANLPKIHSDSILPSTPWSSERSLSFGLSHQNVVQFSLLYHACHMPRPPHSNWLDLPNDIWGWAQIMKFLVGWSEQARWDGLDTQYLMQKWEILKKL